MKKNSALFIVVIISLFMAAGCSNEKVNPSFNATVMEVYENSVLVEPFEGSSELKSASRIVVSCDVISTNEIPELKVGATIKVLYDGLIAETFPAQIDNVFAIYLIDADGNKVGEAAQGEMPPVAAADSTAIAEFYRPIFEQASMADALQQLDTIRGIVKCLGDAGYAAVDRENQVDMVNSYQVEEFVAKVQKKEKAEQTIICVIPGGSFIRYDLQTTDGKVKVATSSLLWNHKNPEVNYREDYPADTWIYTDNGYLFFDRYHMPGICMGHTAIRVKALNETCRELNRKYIQPIGYSLNNMFITDWSEADGKNLNFYDLYDVMYQMKFNEAVPYVSKNDGRIYQIPEREFEDVLTSYFDISRERLRQNTVYYKNEKAYEYRPRGSYDSGNGAELPYPEVVAYKEYEDGTLLLTVNAVWAEEHLEQAISHQVMIRPLNDGRFQYVSNHIIPIDGNVYPEWYIERLTKDEWEIYYR